jgi:hypothetical protein
VPLASSLHGATEELLVLGYGFDSDMIVDLLRAKLATARREIVKAGGKTIEVVSIRITAIGWQAIEG